MAESVDGFESQSGLGSHAREQRNKLWCLRQDSDIVEFDWCRDRSCRLLALSPIVRSNALRGGRLRPECRIGRHDGVAMAEFGEG